MAMPMWAATFCVVVEANEEKSYVRVSVSDRADTCTRPRLWWRDGGYNGVRLKVVI